MGKSYSLFISARERPLTLTFSSVRKGVFPGPGFLIDPVAGTEDAIIVLTSYSGKPFRYCSPEVFT